VSSGLARIVAGLGAVIGAAALVLQLVLLIAAFHGRGDGALAAVWRYLGFFTILSNAFATAVLAHGFARPKANAGLGSPRTEVAAASALVLVGLIYSLVLRQLWDPHGADRLADSALHDVMPVLTALYWLLRPHGRLRWADAVPCLALPVAYCLYALARGAHDGWYPYPFINIPRIGLLQTAINIAGIGAGFGLLALAFIGVDRLLGRGRR
jgi:hypothetical protein